MKLGSTYVIQKPENIPRNGDTVVCCVKEFQDTEISHQARCWLVLVDCLEKGATVTANTRLIRKVSFPGAVYRNKT
jgi:archaellum component FlaG (FlaF/FlaG flagellin family)